MAQAQRPEVIGSAVTQFMPASVGSGVVAVLRSPALARQVRRDEELQAVETLSAMRRLTSVRTVVVSGFNDAEKIGDAAVELAMKHPFLAERALAISEGFMAMVGHQAEVTFRKGR